MNLGDNSACNAKRATDGDVHTLSYGGHQSLISKSELIKLVKSHGLLWDKTDRRYKHKKHTTAAWKDISQQLIPEWVSLDGYERTKLVSEVIKKWQHLRDAYVKNRKLSKSKQIKPYLFSHMLKFLDPHIDNEIFKNERLNLETEDEEFWSKNDTYVVDQENKSITITSTNQNENNSTEDNIVEALTNIIQRETDEDKAFFNSMLPQVKMLSNESKLQFRVEAMQLLQKLLLKENEQFDNESNIEILECHLDD